MARVVVVLTGPVSAGKTTLAKRLVERYSATHYKTSELLEQLSGGQVARERTAMQEFGEKLDRGTDGAWVADNLVPEINALGPDAIAVIDATRIPEQITALRNGLPRQVVHIHLKATQRELERRYRRRPKTRFQEKGSYAEVLENETERRVEELADDADVVIDTESNTELDVEVRAAAYLGLQTCAPGGLVDVIIGGQYGSEGKGNIAFAIGAEYQLLCRVGGPNAGHKVPLNEPFTHRLLPSATMTSEAPILIGPGAVLDLDILFDEIRDCRVEVGRLHIDEQAMIISSKDKRDERELVAAIGSTGQGVGAATARRITGRRTQTRLARDVPELAPFLACAYEVLNEAYARGDRILLEGTQGTGLSLYHGAYPHVTSRDTTVAGCLAEMGVAPARLRKVIMVCRTYPIRVQSPGAQGKTSGPMSLKTSWAEVSRRSHIPLPELRNVEKGSVSGKQRRVGEFDWELLQRAARLNGATDVALTFVDYLDIRNRNARRFDQLDQDTIYFIEEVERVAGAPVSLISTRFDMRSVIDRRAW
ncbi:MAG TPA: adenylosuccinate synthetase [Solirubrobacteraceae bacterium]|nr:adenylosuccinate synthetase [Solirubrobacteraceae bacterium]